ncbi:hypothetical protein [Microvirga lenta]|uniref:hypothetical protein n=1 Tax=Microvirga lenta TaxID=2881337 RepID=UPI001CFC7348|nr:hypothetical protein [Microvirga lenta]MCB5173911.1 hypothetical protein [Microvirga lenta]
MTSRRHHLKPFDYGHISIADKEALRGCASAIAVIARKTNLQILELGEILERAKALVPRGFERWVSRECQMTPKTAGNYIRVHQRFGSRRDSIADLGIKPTTLVKLATAPDEVVDEIFSRLEAGETLIGRDVEQILRAGRPLKNAKSQVEETVHEPGRKGLIAFLTGCMRTSVDEWIERLTALHAKVEAAMPDGKVKKRFHKGELVKAVAWEATWLRIELERMSGCEFWNKANQYLGKAWKDRPQWPEGRWQDVNDALLTLERSERINVDDLVSALRSEVLPALGWALGRDPVLAEDGQTLPPEFVREMDRLGIGAAVIEAGDPIGEPDNQHADPVAEPNIELAIATCQVETGACPAVQTDSIVLPTDLTASVIPPIDPVSGISTGASSEGGKGKGFKRPPVVPPRPSREGSASGSGPLP